MKRNHHFAKDYRIIRARKQYRRKIRKLRYCRIPHKPDCSISCPRYITVNHRGARLKFLKFLESLRRAIANGRRKPHLDFRPLEKVDATGGILLRSELDRLGKLYTDLKFSGTMPLNRKCRHVLTQIGISRFPGMHGQKGHDEDVIHWRAVTGNDVDGAAYAEKLMEPYIDRLPEELQGSLFVGVSEAMTNVKQHAYLESRRDGLRDSPHQESRWWMFSQEKDSRLTVLICDLGVGIPRTLPLSDLGSLKGVKRWARLNARKDGEILSAVLKATRKAIESNRVNPSRTLEPHRGRGLYNIIHLVREVENSDVMVMSNKGAWEKLHSEAQDAKMNFPTSIKGTIIGWSVPLGEAT